MENAATASIRDTFHNGVPRLDWPRAMATSRPARNVATNTIATSRAIGSNRIGMALDRGLTVELSGARADV
jgi:hypothetical protein